MSKRLEKHTANALAKVQEGEHVPSHVFLPPAMRKMQVFNGTPPDLKAQIARVENEADPVGLLIAVAIGQPVPEFHVNADGDISATYGTLPINNRYRLKVIEYLADQVMKKRQPTEQRSEDQGWAATIRSAASRGQDE